MSFGLDFSLLLFLTLKKLQDLLKHRGLVDRFVVWKNALLIRQILRDVLNTFVVTQRNALGNFSLTPDTVEADLSDHSGSDPKGN